MRARRDAHDVGHEVDFGMGVAVDHAALAAFLVVHDEADRDPGAAGPSDLGASTTVADQVTRGSVVHASSLPCALAAQVRWSHQAS